MCPVWSIIFMNETLHFWQIFMNEVSCTKLFQITTIHISFVNEIICIKTSRLVHRSFLLFPSMGRILQTNSFLFLSFFLDIIMFKQPPVDVLPWCMVTTRIGIYQTTAQFHFEMECWKNSGDRTVLISLQWRKDKQCIPTKHLDRCLDIFEL